MPVISPEDLCAKDPATEASCLANYARRAEQITAAQSLCGSFDETGWKKACERTCGHELSASSSVQTCVLELQDQHAAEQHRAREYSNLTIALAVLGVLVFAGLLWYLRVQRASRPTP